MPEAEAGPACPVPLGPALGQVWSGPCLVGALPSLGALCSPALPPPVGDLRDFVRSHLGNPELPFYLCEFAYSLPLPPPRAFPQNTRRLLRPRPRGGHGGPNPAPMPVHPLLLAWPPGPRSWGDTSPPRRASRWRRLGPPEAVLQADRLARGSVAAERWRGLWAEGSSEHPSCGLGSPCAFGLVFPGSVGKGRGGARRDGAWGVG